MNLPFTPNQTQKPETKQAVCDPWLRVAGRKYWIEFPVWAIVNLKGTSSSNLIFPQSVATFQREESVFLVWCIPSSRKENAAEAVPAGCDPNLHSQSPSHGISKAGMGVQTKETRCLDCKLPLEQLPWEGGDGRRGGGWKKIFSQVKTIEKEKASEASCWQNVGFCGNPTLWGAVSLSERFQQEKSKSLIFTSSRMVNAGSVERYW